MLREVVMGYPDQETLERYERGEIEIGGCVISAYSPPGSISMSCINRDWEGHFVDGKRVPPSREETRDQLMWFEYKWRDNDCRLELFDEIGDYLADAELLGNLHAVEVVGIPALNALRERFGIMNNAFHNIAWYVGESYFLNNDTTGIRVLQECEQVLKHLQGPSDEVRLDVLAQLGWLATIAGKHRLAYRSYRERFDQMSSVFGIRDPDVVKAKELARNAAAVAGFHHIAAQMM